ncbi:hypothetical protein LIA77_11830 [Sarocladium implicatum]|nr:hypothetical protein LIA77_11830 [Sarocladium implicatum]
MSPHTALGIAQIIFYVPVVPLAIWLMKRNGWKRPKLAWWPFIPFSLLRLAGGPLVIALHKDPTNVGLAIAAIVCLNVGVVPLIVAASGFLRIVIVDNFNEHEHARRTHKLLRILTIVAIGLLAGGGSLSGQPSQKLRSIGRGLSFAGYGLFTAQLLSIVLVAIHFYRIRQRLLPSSQRVILALFIACPFLAVRTAYGLLQVQHQESIFSKWDPLYGSVSLFAAMALLMEYITLAIFMSVGFSIPPDRGVPPKSTTPET